MSFFSLLNGKEFRVLGISLKSFEKGNVGSLALWDAVFFLFRVGMKSGWDFFYRKPTALDKECSIFSLFVLFCYTCLPLKAATGKGE